eukprot:8748331-Prorocentrum_lima.AAC.1
MMWENQAIEYWKTTAGGGLGQTEAKAKWDDWALHWREREIPSDFLSPNPDKRLRLRIPTADMVDFLNCVKDTKEVTKGEQ